LVQGFVQRVDADRQLIQVTFGLDLPEWLPDGSAPDLCVVQRSTEASA
jgi:hypothetical protein